jgi:erythromycin esterase
MKLSSKSEIIKRASEYSTIIIGESSHGIHEFAKEKFELTLDLIKEDLVSFVAVEWDWSDCFSLNLYVRGDTDELHFKTSRWPYFMWMNSETHDFIQELRMINSKRKNKIGFYGLDMFGLSNCIIEINEFLKRNELDLLSDCVDKINNEQSHTTQCNKQIEENKIQIISQVKKLLYKVETEFEQDEEVLNFKMCCKIIIATCNSYKSKNGWDIRENHMFDTYKILSKRYNYGRGVILAHNTHVQNHECVTQHIPSISGKLKDSIFRIALICHSGQTFAATRWGKGNEKIMNVKPPSENSWENEIFKMSSKEKFYILFDKMKNSKGITNKFRAIGAVYSKNEYLDLDLNCSFHAIIAIRHVSPIHVI